MNNKQLFIYNSQTIFGKNAFDYSQVKYVNAITRITLVCKKHKHSFTVRPCDHLHYKQSCKICRLDINEKQLKVELKKKFPNETFSFNYTGSNFKIDITCKHDTNFLSYSDFEKGFVPCKKCKQEARKSRAWTKFLEEAKKVHGEVFDYSKAEKEFKNIKSLITIKCPIHGLFVVRAYDHIIGRIKSCPKCKIFNRYIARTKKELGIELNNIKELKLILNQKIKVLKEREKQIKTLK